MLKAKALVDGKNTLEAINILSSALDSEKNSKLYLKRADIYISLNQLDKAISDLKEADGMEPGIGSYGLARAYSLKGDPAMAISYLEKNMNSAYKIGEKEVLLDKYLTKISNTPEWKQFIKKDWYSKIESSISEIEYYVSLGRTSEALEILKDLENNYPEDPRLSYIKGYIAYANDQYREAMLIMVPLVDDEPYNVEYLNLLANSRFAMKNYAGAAESYLRLLNIGSDDASLLLKLAECYKGIFAYDKAISYIDIYLSLYPSNVDALNIGGSIERASGNYTNALRYYSKCLDEDSGEPRFYIDRADTYFVLKSWELAANDYGMALDLNPGNAESWLNKGISHLNLKQLETGCFCLEMAKKMGNDKASSLLERNCD